MKRLLWVFWFVSLFGKLSHAHIKATDLSGCEPAIASYEPADIPLEKYVSHLATANIVSNRKFAEFIRDFPDILQDKPLRRYPELQGQWDILWDMVRKKQLENLSELLTHLKQPEPSDEDRRINGHENTELFADEAPVDAGNWIEDRINEQDEPFNDLPQEERDWQRHGKTGEYWRTPDEENEAANYDSPEWKKVTILALLKFNPKMTRQELADKSGVDLSHAISLLEELQKENRIGWIDDNHEGVWIVINERNYDRWIYLKISSLLTQNPEMSKREIADKTGRSYSEIFEIVKALRKTTILALLTQNPEMSKQELANTLNLSVATISVTIEELETEKRLLRRGGNSGEYWLVFDKKGQLISYDPHERRKETILALWAKNPYWTAKDISNESGIPITAVRQIATALQREEVLIREGSGPSRYWLVPNKENGATVDPHQLKKEAVLSLIIKDPEITTQELVDTLGFSVEQIIEELKAEKRLGGKSSGPRGSRGVFDKQGRLISHDPHERRKETILALWAKNPHWTVKDMSNETGIAITAVKRVATALQREGVLVSNKGKDWRVFDKQGKLISHNPHQLKKEAVLSLIIKDPEITTQELVDTLGFSVRRIIEALKAEKQLRGKSRGTGEYYWQVFDKQGKLISHDPHERRKETILALWTENPHWTVKDMSNETGIAITAVRQIAAELQREGVLIHEGSGPGGYWKTLNKKSESFEIGR